VSIRLEKRCQDDIAGSLRGSQHRDSLLPLIASILSRGAGTAATEAARAGQINQPETVPVFIHAYYLSWIFTILWILSIVPAYLLGRLWLPVQPAMVFAFCAVFNPCTLNFTPGKNPAQLLTILTALFGGFAGYLRGSWWRALVGGVAWAVDCTVGLIHVWIAGIALGCMMWHALESGSQRRLIRSALFPAAGGAAAVMIAAWLIWGWNVPATLWAVAIRYGRIQPEIITHPLGWTFLGVPIFFLFAGPGLWVNMTWSSSKSTNNEEYSWGRRMLLFTLFVLFYTYFFANN